MAAVFWKYQACLRVDNVAITNWMCDDSPRKGCYNDSWKVWGKSRYGDTEKCQERMFLWTHSWQLRVFFQQKLDNCLSLPRSCLLAAWLKDFYTTTNIIVDTVFKVFNIWWQSSLCDKNVSQYRQYKMQYINSDIEIQWTHYCWQWRACLIN